MFLKGRSKFSFHINKQKPHFSKKTLFRSQTSSSSSSFFRFSKHVSSPWSSRFSMFCNTKRTFSTQITLSQVQQSAIKSSFDSSLLINGTAGTGKSKTLLYRAAYIIQKNPESGILFFTNTNKIAETFKHELELILDKELLTKLNESSSPPVNVSHPLVSTLSKNIIIGTFPAICLTILKKEKLVDKYCTILDEEEQRDIVKQSMKKISTEVIYDYLVDQNLHFIFWNKSNGLTCSDPSLPPEKAKVYQEYEQHKKDINSIDLCDIILLLLQSFQSKPELLKKYQKKYNFILMDDYQNISKVESDLLVLLSSQNKVPLNVTRDLFSSIQGSNCNESTYFFFLWNDNIYSFKTLLVQIVKSFETTFPCNQFLLPLCYRSSASIVNTYNFILSQQGLQLPLAHTTNPLGSKVKIFHCSSSNQEAEIIASLIKEIKFENADLHYSDIAVLSRFNYSSNLVEEQFLYRSIPFETIKEYPWTKNRLVKALLAYLSSIINTKNNDRFLSAIRFPKRGLGLKTEELLSRVAQGKNSSLFSALENLDISNLHYAGRKKALESIQHEFKTYKAMLKKKLNPSELIKTILKEAKIHVMFEEKNYFQSFLDALDAGTNHTGPMIERISRFLDWYGLKMNTDVYPSTDSVVLATIHQARGYEWKVVFLMGVSKDVFSNSLYFFDKEEERRTLYVAMARAKQLLYISYANEPYEFLNFTESLGEYVSHLDLSLKNDEEDVNETGGKKLDKEKKIKRKEDFLKKKI